MTADTVVQTEDLVPVRSRISWGAIIGGSVLALSLYILLTLLGAAAGLSITGNVSAQSLGVGAAIFAVIVTCVCLFVGGFYASRLTVGENGVEAATYGVLVWGVVLAALVGLMALGVSTGFNAMIGVSTTARIVAPDAAVPSWEEGARQAGVPSERISEWKQKAQESPATVRQAVEDPQNRQAALDAARRVTWYTFFGAWLSLVAAAFGGYVGGGPTMRLFAVPARGAVATTRVPVAGRI